jgi:hypothetical protein
MESADQAARRCRMAHKRIKIPPLHQKPGCKRPTRKPSRPRTSSITLTANGATTVGQRALLFRASPDIATAQSCHYLCAADMNQHVLVDRSCAWTYPLRATRQPIRRNVRCREGRRRWWPRGLTNLLLVVVVIGLLLPFAPFRQPLCFFLSYQCLTLPSLIFVFAL